MVLLVAGCHGRGRAEGMGRATVLRKAESLGVSVSYFRDLDGYTVEMQSPRGVRFFATDCHAMSLTGEVASETWRDVGEDFALGLVPCEGDCWCRS